MKKIILHTGEELIIREAEIRDAAAIIQYSKLIGEETDLLSFNAADFNKTIEEQEKAITIHSENDSFIFLVAEIGNEIVSLLNAHGSKRPRLRHAREFGISVKKKHWKKGIATAIIEYMLKWASEQEQVKKINLKVLKHNAKAIALYKKLGFNEEGVLRRDFFLNGEYFDCQLMGIDVD